MLLLEIGWPLARLWSGMVSIDTLPPAGVLEGRVIGGLDAPLRYAIVDVGTSRMISTDSAGGFRFSGLPQGQYTVSARSIGFTPGRITVRLGPSSGWRGIIRLEPTPQTLPEIVARAPSWKPPQYNATTRYDDFFHRRRLGFGRFLDRDAIEKSNASNLFQLMQGLPGVRVVWNPPGSDQPSWIRMARCPPTPPKMAVHIDGLRIHWDLGICWDCIARGDLEERRQAHERFAEAFESVQAHDIEMMEIYRGVSELPSDLPDRDVCGAVVIYTRWRGAKPDTENDTQGASR